MKHFKSVAIVAAFLMLATTANAQSMFFKSSNNTNLIESDKSNEPTILTFYIITDHEFTTEYSEQLYFGTSTSAPCSDLKPFGQALKNTMKFHKANYVTTSSDLVDTFPVPATCVAFDISMNGNNYSTGNIKVLWDESSKSYTAATPNKIEIDVSKGDQPSN
jgi:hypothetical protein